MVGWRAARTLQEIISCNAHSKHTHRHTHPHTDKEAGSAAAQRRRSNQRALAVIIMATKRRPGLYKAKGDGSWARRWTDAGTCGLNIKITLCVVFAALLRRALLCISKQTRLSGRGIRQTGRQAGRPPGSEQHC